MFKKMSLLAVSALACLGGLVSCNTTKDDTSGFDQNDDDWTKSDLTLALTGSIDYIEGYTAWNPEFSQKTDALKFTKTEEGIYTLDFDFVTDKEYKIVSGSTWNEAAYGFDNVDTEKSIASIADAGGNIKAIADAKVTITFYEYPFQNADKINSTKKMIISERE